MPTVVVGELAFVNPDPKWLQDRLVQPRGAAARKLDQPRRAGAHFSVTVRMDPTLRRTITSIDEHAWIPIKYPNAIFDEQTDTWISDAEIAEMPYTAFASARAHRSDGRLIVRRVKRFNPKATAQGQQELFAAYRYYAVFTDSSFQLTQAESDHRGHAVIEQVFADLIDGPWAHLPSMTPGHNLNL